MFELMKAYEIANSEENKLLRSIYLAYTRIVLKRSFFNKFGLDLMDIDKDLLNEFIQLYNCVNESVTVDRAFPYIEKIINNNQIFIKYYYFKICISYVILDYQIIIIDEMNDNAYISLQLTEDQLNSYPYKEIIFMAIYNYCVSYIYGFTKINMFMGDTKYASYLKQLYI